MASSIFVNNFKENIAKTMKNVLSDEPLINYIGDKENQADSLKNNLADFTKEFVGQAMTDFIGIGYSVKRQYEINEMIFGYFPVHSSMLEKIYFQIGLVNLKGKTLATLGEFGAIISNSIKEPYLLKNYGWMSMGYVPLSLLSKENKYDVPKSFYKNKEGITGLSESLNNDKKLIKSLYSATAKSISYGNTEFSFKAADVIGLSQLLPYKGKSFVFFQNAGNAIVADKSNYFFDAVHTSLSLIAEHIKNNEESQISQDILFPTPYNDRIIKAMIENAIGTT
ncbi:MAG: hypothetical protein EHM85_05860 [Desulfobacteraceae bacterium]|nr:MAG: hypothetical protein EHM85_05860 [Desulfobacteraceae bacterium]